MNIRNVYDYTGLKGFEKALELERDKIKENQSELQKEVKNLLNAIDEMDKQIKCISDIYQAVQAWTNLMMDEFNKRYKYEDEES